MIETHAWNDELDLAHEAMDHEHHLQIALVSAFVEAVEQRRPTLARQLAGQLLHYSSAHFSSEELLMEASGHAGRETHAAEHAAFLAQMRDLEATFDQDQAEVALAAALDIRSALGGHIRGMDRRLAERTR